MLKSTFKQPGNYYSLRLRIRIVFHSSNGPNHIQLQESFFLTIREHNAVSTRSLENREGNFTSMTTHEIRISRSLCVVVFAFMLCWTPVWLITILTRLRIVDTMPRNIKLLCTFFLNLSNTVNPFIYAGMNPLFRREFRRFLYCRPREPDIRQASSENVRQRPNRRVDVTGHQ